MLDRFQLAGVIASWWGDVQYDVKTLAFHGFSGVVQGWLTTIEAAFADDDEDEVRDKQKRAAEKRKARDHRIVPVLIPDYLNLLDQAETSRADLEAQVKTATAPGDDEADDVSVFSAAGPEEAKGRPRRGSSNGSSDSKGSSSTASSKESRRSSPSPKKPSSAASSRPTFKTA